MARIFRSARKAEAEQGNILSYLRYAIGEIALLVIGILIALQVNNLNQADKAREAELELTNRLVQDLRTDEEMLKFLIRELRKKQDLHYALYEGSFNPAKDRASGIIYHLIFAPVVLQNHEETPGKLMNDDLRAGLNAYLTDLKYGNVAMEILKEELEQVRTQLVDLGLVDLDRVFASGRYELPNPETTELIDLSRFQEAKRAGRLDAAFLNLKMSTAYAIRDLEAILRHNRDFREKIEARLQE